MNKIAIVTRMLTMGGVGKCLVTMLEKYSKYCDITVFVMGEGGELYDQVPDGVKIVLIPEIENTWKRRVVSCIKRGQIREGSHIFCNILKIRNTSVFSEQCRLLSDTLPDYADDFDVAIAYYTPVSFPVVYVINHIRAKKKILWLHTDLEKMGIDLYEMRPEHGQYDSIVGVSEHIRDQMIHLEPENADKTIAVMNCYDVENIIAKAKSETIRDEKWKDTIVLSTVGRLSSPKKQVWIPGIAKRLKLDGFVFKWFIVGDGEERDKLLSEIEKHEVQDCVLWVGNKDNPYPYMNDCDIYVQPSVYEGFCTTTYEAKILHIPVITTDVSGAREQFVNGYDGMIVGCSTDDVYQGIKKMIVDESYRKMICDNLKMFEYRDSDFYTTIFGRYNGK